MAGLNENPTEQDLKRALQSILEKECGQSMSDYGFKFSRISVYRGHENYSINFLVEICNPNMKDNLNIQQAVSYKDLAFYNNKIEHVYAHVFHQIAHRINNEILRVTKDMPMMVNNRMYGNLITSSSLTNSYSVGASGAYCNVTATEPIPQKIVREYNDKKPDKKSKFEAIDLLISESKQRLLGGYASPKLAFQYF